ncbi:MAG: hypothetical protein ABFR89_11525 [Actinomycetota bacterium]
MTLLLAVVLVMGVAVPALAYSAHVVDTGEGCTIGAHAFEHWTKARHISWDDNYGCNKITQKRVRRCMGDNIAQWEGPTTANTIDRQYAVCDAISTHTFGYDINGDKYDSWAYSGP